MGFRIPAPDGKKGRDGHPVLVLPDGTEIRGGYTLSYFTVGGMSVAYRGIREGQTFFIKEVESTDNKKVASLMQEREILERLSHPGIVKVYDFFEYDGFHYLVQEFVDGQTLERLISPIQDVFLQERVIIDWASQILDIIEYLHMQSPRIIYRDLKPSNIIRDRQGKIRLVDFGIARLYREGKSKDTESMGSALTASPEHYGRGQTDVRSDIFTIGATLHCLATNGRDRSEIPFDYEAVRSINPKISPALEYVIHKAIELDPARRFQSVAEMRMALLGRAESSEMPPLRGNRPVAGDRASSPPVRGDRSPAQSMQFDRPMPHAAPGDGRPVAPAQGGSPALRGENAVIRPEQNGKAANPLSQESARSPAYQEKEHNTAVPHDVAAASSTWPGGHTSREYQDSGFKADKKKDSRQPGAAGRGLSISQLSPLLGTAAFVIVILLLGALAVRYIVFAGSDGKENPAAQTAPIAVSTEVVLNDSWPHPQNGSTGKPKGQVAGDSDKEKIKSLITSSRETNGAKSDPAPGASGDPRGKGSEPVNTIGSRQSGDQPGRKGTSRNESMETHQSGQPSAGSRKNPGNTGQPPTEAPPALTDTGSSHTAAAPYQRGTPAAHRPAAAPQVTESPVAVVAPSPTPTKPAGPVFMCPIGSVLDGDVMVPENRFRVRIPRYKRVAPGPGEVPDRETTVYSFSKRGSSDGQERFLKVVICNAPRTLEDQNVYNLYYNKLHRDGGTEIEKLDKYGNEFRGVFKVTELIDNSEADLTIEQRLILSSDRKSVYILVAGGSSAFFRTYQIEEFNTFFSSFSFL
jgi:serine/threonine protein kinase